MPPLTLLIPGSLNGEPGLLAECPGVFGSRLWQDWFGWPGAPGGFAAKDGPARPRVSAATADMTSRERRITVCLLAGIKPGAVLSVRTRSYMMVTDWTVIRFTCVQPFVRAVVLHELGHLVGVSHVTSASQLMFSQIQPPTAQVVAPAELSVITVGGSAIGARRCRYLERLAVPSGSARGRESDGKRGHRAARPRQAAVADGTCEQEAMQLVRCAPTFRALGWPVRERRTRPTPTGCRATRCEQTSRQPRHLRRALGCRRRSPARVSGRWCSVAFETTASKLPGMTMSASTSPWSHVTGTSGNRARARSRTGRSASRATTCRAAKKPSPQPDIKNTSGAGRDETVQRAVVMNVHVPGHGHGHGCARSVRHPARPRHAVTSPGERR